MAGRNPKRSKSSGRDPRPAATRPAKRKPAPKPEPPEPTLELVPVAPPPHVEPRVQIVAIGASAGGLEALSAFFRNTRADSGLAYVIVQHLDPHGHGQLVELLQRSTQMRVAQVTDGLEVEPDHVYVIPPGSDLSVMHGVLHLLPQAHAAGLRLPIDFFFRSLAEDQQESSIGVVLSGMGSDGTIGLRAIKEKAGASFVQAPDSAKFDAMPRSAVDAGVADVVAPVEELPGRILAYRTHVPHISRAESLLEHRAQTALEKIFSLLRAQTGNDFSLYKKSTILRRIERRMGLHQIDSLAYYVRFLRENPREVELLFKELLIGVTSFFRDPPAWEYLKNDVLPAMIATRPHGGTFRAWVPGCSTGEEAYSLAIVFKEAVEPLRPLRNVTLQIFATDLDRDAIDKARTGLFPDSIVAEVSPERLRRFFVQEERGYRIGKEIREMVVFAPQNVCTDPPFTKLDILSCRNLLIYFSSELQQKLLPLFHYALNPGGILFLGSAETIGTSSGQFVQLDSKARIYRKLDRGVRPENLAFQTLVPPSVPVLPAASSEGDRGAARGPAPNLQALADRVLAQRFAPLGTLCTDKGDILYISGRAGKYFEPAVGKANLNVFAMAREGLRYDLSKAFAQALRQDRPAVARGITVGTNGGTQVIDLTVQRLVEPKELRDTVLIVITDVPGHPAPPRPVSRPAKAGAHPHFAEIERELQRAREEIQITREEMQTSQEELKSTNEELQSTNEELQSTNEELTTSKEEMQSLNEELQTVNQELQAKVDELSRSNNDMKNLLNSTDIATLFLDGELRVRRFTTPTVAIIKLIPADVGRPITDIASDLDYPDLADDAREVLRTLVFREKQAGTRDGRWFSVRIMPYRTLENRIDGVVITFMDASAIRQLASAAQEQASLLAQLAESLPALVLGFRADGSCDVVSKRWLDYTGTPEAEQLGFGWLDRLHPDDRERVREAWRAAVRDRRMLVAEMRIRSASGEHHCFEFRSIPIRNSRGDVQKWYATSTDADVKHAPR